MFKCLICHRDNYHSKGCLYEYQIVSPHQYIINLEYCEKCNSLLCLCKNRIEIDTMCDLCEGHVYHNNTCKLYKKCCGEHSHMALCKNKTNNLICKKLI